MQAKKERFLMTVFVSTNLIDATMTQFAIMTGDFKELNFIAENLFNSEEYNKVLMLKLTSLVLFLTIYALIKNGQINSPNETPSSLSSNKNTLDTQFIADKAMAISNLIMLITIVWNSLQIHLYNVG